MWGFSKRYFILLIASLFLMWPAKAQNNRLLRVELEVRPNSQPFHLVSLEENGLLIMYPAAAKQNGEAVWVIQCYNNELKTSWKREELTPPHFELLGWEYESGKANILFGGKGGNQGESARILSVDAATGSAKTFNLQLTAGDDIYYFGLKGAWFVLAGSDRKFNTRVYLIDKEGAVSVVSTGIESEHWLDDVLWDPSRQEMNLLLKKRESRKKQGMVLLNFSPGGEIKERMDLFEDNIRWPSAGRLVLNKKGELFVLGTYSRDDRVTSFQNQSPAFEEASGFFSYKADTNKAGMQIQFYPFSAFSDYFNYLSSYEVSRMRSGQSQEMSASIDFKIILHDLEILNGYYVLAAEAYYEKYQYITRMTYDYYGRPVPSSYTVFDGYEYTNTFIAGIDSSGNKLWDNNFEIRNFIRMERKKIVELLPNNEDLILSYMNNGQIASKMIRGKDVLSAFSYTPLEGVNASDRVDSGIGEKIIHWYGNYALVYGYQKIKSLASPGGEKRSVFYFSKVTYK